MRSQLIIEKLIGESREYEIIGPTAALKWPAVKRALEAAGYSVGKVKNNGGGKLKYREVIVSTHGSSLALGISSDGQVCGASSSCSGWTDGFDTDELSDAIGALVFDEHSDEFNAYWTLVNWVDDGESSEITDTELMGAIRTLRSSILAIGMNPEEVRWPHDTLTTFADVLRKYAKLLPGIVKRRLGA